MRIKNGMNDGVFIKRWDDPIYSTKFWVVITKQLQDFDPLFRKITKTVESEISPSAAAYCYDLTDPGGHHHVMLVFTEDATIAYVVHETIHAVNAVFLKHGVKLDPTNDEHQAYYTQRLVENTLDVFKDLDQYKIKKEKVNNAGKRKKR